MTREPGVKTPDAEITKDRITLPFEFKTTEADRAETIISKATKDVKQGKNIAVDVSQVGTTEQNTIEALTRLSGSDKLPDGSTVTIIGNGYAVKLTK